MKTMLRIVLSTSCVLVLSGLFASVGAQTYIGDSACIGCHNSVRPAVGYNIAAEYQKTGHPYKLNPVSGGPPTYPANTSPGVTQLPPGTNWANFTHVIGGYGWKARWIKTDGRVYTVGDSAQYNHENGSWAAYNKGQTVKYNHSCFKCHTTGASTTGSWTGVDADSMGTFAQPGIRCEGCHGPGSAHQASPVAVKPPNQGNTLKLDVCAPCHSRGSLTNAIPVSGGFIRHHEQFNEMKASKHLDGRNMDLTCADCHDTHIPLLYPNAAGTHSTSGQKLKGISTTCQSCHSGKTILLNGSPKMNIDCIDCHMPKATKTAVSSQVGNGWKGDIKTHIMAINTNAVTKDSMFAGSSVRLDANGLASVTLDFACLQCHTTRTVSWASTYAKSIHTVGLTAVEGEMPVPETFGLHQNFPNPFNPSTTIRFDLPLSGTTRLAVYDIAGQLMATLIDNPMPAGEHAVTLDASRFASGIYIYTLESGSFRVSRKMILMK